MRNLQKAAASRADLKRLCVTFLFVLTAYFPLFLNPLDHGAHALASRSRGPIRWPGAREIVFVPDGHACAAQVVFRPDPRCLSFVPSFAGFCPK